MALPEVREHLRNCAACAEELASLQKTMALLDEWQAPDASPYFGFRLRARVREEASVQPSGWLAWLRRPVVAAAAMVLVGIGVSLLELGNFGHDSNTLANNGDAVLHNISSPAVSDLQYLDKNAELFSEFDALDGQSSTE
jgi:anti-sigma factor RsiW